MCLLGLGITIFLQPDACIISRTFYEMWWLVRMKLLHELWAQIEKIHTMWRISLRFDLMGHLWLWVLLPVLGPMGFVSEFPYACVKILTKIY